MEAIVKVYKKGRITLPKAIREIYNIREGDMLRIEILEKFVVQKKQEEATK